MESDVIAVCEDFIKLNKLDICLACCEGVICDNGHTECLCALCNHCTDCAETDNTESFAEDFGACEVALAFFNELADVVALALECLAPIERSGNLS